MSEKCHFCFRYRTASVKIRIFVYCSMFLNTSCMKPFVIMSTSLLKAYLRLCDLTYNISKTTINHNNTVQTLNAIVRKTDTACISLLTCDLEAHLT